VARDDRILAEVVVPNTQSHGRILPSLLAQALERAHVGWDDVEGLAVSIGPGSFTGLRIGLSLAKGIAYAGNLPIAAVPTLEALAWTADVEPGEIVWAILDARMKEVYAASFERTPTGLARRSPDEALPPDALAPRIAPDAVIVGDAATTYPALAASGARVLAFETHHPRGGIVARLGAAMLANGRCADLGTLEPTYVRASQAELTTHKRS
jgi:tRNA threonylcarbamoyladenosine biosynthesis protein TsaB